MSAKTSGYVLSVDQASKSAGASLWLDGKLKATALFLTPGVDKYSRRVQELANQCTAFLDRELPAGVNIEKIVFEQVKMRLVVITAGAFLTSPRIDARIHETASFVPSTSWKAWARDRGATGPFKEIKGMRALRETGFDLDSVAPMNDDVADSILIYRVWAARP